MTDPTRQLENLSPEQRLLFEALLAEKRQARQAAPAQRIPRRQEHGLVPPSFAQQRLWFFDQLDPGNLAYNVPLAVRLEGELDAAALEQSLNEVIRRHELLRARFEIADGQPLLAIAPELRLPMPLLDLRGAAEAEVGRLAAEDNLKPYDLARGPLLRATLLRLADDEHVLLLNMHHIISDGWSLGVLVRELAALYTAALRGQPAALPELPIQYADYAVWQRQQLQGETLAAKLAYWKGQLGGELAPLELPTDRPRPSVQTFAGARHYLSIAQALSEQLTALSQREKGTTLFMVMLAAFKVLLQRYTGQDDLLVGSPVAGRERPELEGLIGFFVNMLVLRTDLSGDPSFLELLGRIREVTLEAYARQDLPFEQLVNELQPERDLSRNPLFQVTFGLQNNTKIALALPNLTLRSLDYDSQTARFDLEVNFWKSEQGLGGFIEYNSDLFDAATIARLAGHYQTLLAQIAADPARPISALPLLAPAEERQLLVEWNATRRDLPGPQCVHELFERQAAQTPEPTALIFEGQRLSFRELNARANRLARRLRRLGVGPDTIVGVYLERSVELVVALYGILKAGGAYLPLDPAYPAERLAFMLQDAGAPVLLTQRALEASLPSRPAHVLCLDRPDPAAEQEAPANLALPCDPASLAYVIYTSGSTGRPKGVMIEHRNVANFFVGMDEHLGAEQPGVWLATTSVSFDISVLELFWTLTRGYTVVLQQERADELFADGAAPATDERGLDFSLFYFASDSEIPAREQYRLLLEGARFADEHGFTAVWTPERHFHAFGGFYPNPSVASAALATITSRVKLRAGSVVLPLHHPIRVAEEWALVDNLSQGRAGISFASGWHADDFVFAPERYAGRKEALLEGMETVRRLWRGEAISLQGGAGNQVEVRSLPRPVQPELPVWLTAAGNPETFRLAGELGVGLLTHLLGQSVEELAQKLELYRQAWSAAGHAGAGHVVLMLHTFVGPNRDVVRETVRRPFTSYLRSSIDLLRNLARSLGQDIESMTEDDQEALLEHAFERYFETSGLFGSPESCLPLIGRLKACGVDEVACLVDFGVDVDAVLASLGALDQLRRLSNRRAGADDDYSLAAQVRRHGATHLQCTPSLMRMLASDPGTFAALGQLRAVLLGGEALPAALARQLLEALPADLHNMYGPTETTIWSTTQRVTEAPGATVPIGRPIANTEIYILDRQLRPVPAGVAGELYIGGAGVARGYLDRPALTAERFRPNPFGDLAGARIYRTGDLARYRPDGTLEFLGRVDQQVKLRGHRVELEEIDALLGRQPGVLKAVTIVREDAPGDQRLVSYVAPEHAAQPEALRAALAAQLPEHMVPSAIVLLAALPLTPNGKLDRRALPAPSAEHLPQQEGYVGPRTPVEALLAQIWSQVLGLERVGVHDNFFHLGGNSLLATQIISRVREAFKVDLSLRSFFAELPLRSFFAAPTIAGMAENIKAANKQEQRLQPQRFRDERRPASFAQERLWFLEQIGDRADPTGIPLAIALTGRLNLAALEHSLNEVVRRHEALRTTFAALDGRLVQIVAPTLELELAVELASPAEDPARWVLEQAGADSTIPFDLAAGPLLRARLFRLGDQSHALLLIVHQAIFDVWSSGVLIRELGELYAAFAAGRPSPLAAAPIQFADYVYWQHRWLQSEEGELARAYWRQRLAGAPQTLALPADLDRPPVQRQRGARESLTVAQPLAGQLKELGEREGVNLFVTLLAAFQVMLHAATGEVDLVIGSPVAGRNMAEVERLIGLFSNILLLRGDLAGNPSLREVLGRTRDMAIEAFEHQELPFEALARELRAPRDLSRHPLCQVLFSFGNVPMAPLALPDLTMSALPAHSDALPVDLSFLLWEQPDGIGCYIGYNPDLFVPETIAALKQSFQLVLEQLVRNPELRLAELPLRIAPHPRAAQALPAAAPSHVAPRDDVEALLVDIWSRLLGAGEPGVHDNFFHLGGSSLLALQLVELLRETLQVDLPAQLLFLAPTIAELARAVEEAFTGEDDELDDEEPELLIQGQPAAIAKE